MNRWLQPRSLEGKYVRLEPMTMNHLDGLKEAARDGELWKLWFTSVPKPEMMESAVENALSESILADSQPYVVRRLEDNKIVGSTRYCSASPKDRRVEIGYTWYSKSVQRSFVNTECKLLLLTEAFEKLNMASVVFMTHWHNEKSRNAIARLGAKQDGILRNHRILEDGTFRDTVVFSILENEWPAVKNNLLYKLQKDYSS